MSGISDSEGYLSDAHASIGIINIFMAWVALIGRTIGDFRHDLEDSPVWTATEERRRLAERAVWTGALEAMLIFAVLMVATGVAVPLTTTPLDERMMYLVTGSAKIVAGIITGMLSLRVALWLDVYHMWFEYETNVLGTTVIELKHRIRWAISKKFLRMYWLLLVLFQGASASNICIPIVLGLTFGVAIDFSIYKLRRMENQCCSRCLCITLVVILILASSLEMADGIFFIAAVWEDVEDVAQTSWDSYGLLFLLVVLPLLHVVVWRLGLRKKRFETENQSGELEEEGAPKRDQMRKHRMMMSMFFSTRNYATDQVVDVEDKKANMEVVPEELEHEQENDSGVEATAAENNDKNGVDDSDQAGKRITGVESDNSSPATDKIAGAENDEHTPTLKELLMDWKFCGCARGDAYTLSKKISNVVIWTAYITYVLICCFSFFNNAGATAQQQAAKVKLPDVHHILYTGIPINKQPVCAYDNTRNDTDFRQRKMATFPSKEAAHEAGYLILHCGGCGACSDWHNLELEYTTRKFLAAESKDCAQKSLFGGGYNALVECLENPRIGFQGQCAICWADDIECTKKFCWQIGLQSFLINTIGNFAVNNETITSATCEEAHCEAGNPGHFVQCSGATRRRMGIKSDIARPADQQCHNVDVVWSELFPDPHPTDLEY